MPIYEFFSPDSRKIYSFFSHNIRSNDEIPFCPDGKNLRMQRMISGFSITGKSLDDHESDKNIGSNENSENPFSDMEPDKANYMMKELEKSVAGMDDENPDPKQVASLMRKMCEMSGEKVDAKMEEVVRKLEEGRDPAEIEQEMGDFLNESNNSEVKDDEGFSHQSQVKANIKPILRDEKLYDFNEYC